VARKPQAAVLTPAFKLVFISVLVLTVLSIVVSVILALIHPGNEKAGQQVLEASLTTWKLGFGGLVGLIGGKAL
jgi:hypothetical protein